MPTNIALEANRKWRPAKEIKNKVLALISRKSSLLVCGVYNDKEEILGYRPPGGNIKFGETREAAISRELNEELNLNISSLGAWHTIENLFEHEGNIGHEYVNICKVTLRENVNNLGDSIKITESSGTISIAEWIPFEEIVNEKSNILPNGMKKMFRFFSEFNL